MTKNWQPLKPMRSPFLSVNPVHAAEILNRHKTICAFIWMLTEFGKHSIQNAIIEGHPTYGDTSYQT